MAQIDIFDESMHYLGTMEKSQAHQAGHWHKSVHVWITDGENVLLQLRAPEKKSFPNKWDISVAGHVDAGETPLQAAQREFHEELGIPWSFGDIDYACMLKSGTIENNQPAKEFMFLYFVKQNLDLTQLHLPKHEVAAVKYMPYDEFIAEFMQDNNEFIPYPREYKAAVQSGLERLVRPNQETGDRQ